VIGGNAGQAEQYLQTGTHCCIMHACEYALTSQDFDVIARAVDCMHAAHAIGKPAGSSA